MSEEPTNDLEDFVGDNPMRESLRKKLVKVGERIKKLQEKITPLNDEALMYCQMIEAIDERHMKKISSPEGLSCASDEQAAESVIHPVADIKVA